MPQQRDWLWLGGEEEEEEATDGATASQPHTARRMATRNTCPPHSVRGGGRDRRASMQAFSCSLLPLLHAKHCCMCCKSKEEKDEDEEEEGCAPSSTQETLPPDKSAENAESTRPKSASDKASTSRGGAFWGAVAVWRASKLERIDKQLRSSLISSTSGEKEGKQRNAVLQQDVRHAQSGACPSARLFANKCPIRSPSSSCSSCASHALQTSPSPSPPPLQCHPKREHSMGDMRSGLPNHLMVSKD